MTSALSPATLGAIKRLASLIKDDRISNIGFLTGAGTSVASGIPDFRSAGGFYETLRPELITASEEDRVKMRVDPQWALNRDLFLKDPIPYHEIDRPFMKGTLEGKWLPTLTHWFYRLCQDNGKLGRLYTQNIDGLDDMVGLEPKKIVAVHGSMRRVQCEHCGAHAPFEPYYRKALAQTRDILGVDPDAPPVSTSVLCTGCGKPGLKPATVMFGAEMPMAFMGAMLNDFTRFGQMDADGNLPPPEGGEVDQEPDAIALEDMTRTRFSTFDCFIVIGTSLVVYPVASLPEAMPDGVPRVLINRELAGIFRTADVMSEDATDFFLQGDCDVVVLELVKELGWLGQLAAYRHSGVCESAQQLLAETLEGQDGTCSAGGTQQPPTAGGMKSRLPRGPKFRTDV